MDTYCHWDLIGGVNDIYLLGVWGQDQVGLTAHLSEALDKNRIRILDIGQSVIHDQVSLGMLVQFAEGAEQQPIMDEIIGLVNEIGLEADFTTATHEEYTEWVGRQGKAKYVVTMLAREITPLQVAEVAGEISNQGMNIQNIVRLTGRKPLGDTPKLAKACIELSIRGTPTNDGVMRSRFLEIAQQHHVDIAFQADDVFRRNRRLVVFDMDSTLIETEVIDELAMEAGVGEQVAAITEQAMQGELDFQASFRKRLRLLKGLEESALQKVAARLPVTEGAQRLIRNLRQYGYKTAIISGGFDYFGRHLQQLLGIDYVFANQLDIRDGKVTGEVKGDIVDGAKKAEFLKQLVEQEGIRIEQTIAIGDGANDLPMLKLAGLGIAFRAKPIVKQSASQSISTLGLDGVLYLLGFRDEEVHG